MNKAILAGGLAALFAAVAGGIAFAEAEPGAQDRPAHTLRADADGDQRLSRAEFVNGRVARLTAADANRDGSVTPEELRAAGEARRAERAGERFDRLDADDDGAISRAEFDARLEAGRDARADRGPRAERVHRRHDRRSERSEARGPVDVAEAQARAEAAFTRLDADSDGYVTGEERQAARTDMREQRRERMTERRAARQARQASPPAPASE